MGRPRIKTKRDRLPIVKMSGLQGILRLVSYNVPEQIIGAWSPEVCDEVEEWAAREILAAAGDPVRRRPLPAVLANAERFKMPC